MAAARALIRREARSRGTARRPGLEELFFAIDEGIDVVGGKLDAVAVGDRVGGAGFYAVAAEDAAGIIDVIDARVALTSRNTIGLRIIPSLDVDTVRRTRSGAEEAAHAFFEAVFVALKDVDAPIASLDGRRRFRKRFRGRLAEHGFESHAETLVEGDEGFSGFANN